MNNSELLDYLQLVQTHGVGSTLLDRLLERFGSAKAVLSASPNDLSEVEGVGVALIRNIRSSQFREMANKTIESCQRQGVDILLPNDSSFPRLLREIPDPPNVLFTRGQFEVRDALSVAIVGTRTASQYGRTQAERFARALSRAGLTIVSGLARGIDAAAHQGAIEVETGGRTIAVLSSGVIEIFPPQHEQLAEQVVQNGVLLSEMPPGTKPKKGMFPRRNRLISGMSLATIVIEASEHSGSLITARTAGEQGRDVFALPGLVSSANARGSNRLIRDGAILVQDPEDVIESLGPLVENVQISPEETVMHPAELVLNEQEKAVLQAIAAEPTAIDRVVVNSGLPISRVLSTLSVLEMRRLIRRISGQVVQRV
ncbi:MAG: DNA-processing protein DprA [Pirellulales bacterium]